jgi:hypothetical protein
MLGPRPLPAAGRRTLVEFLRCRVVELERVRLWKDCWCARVRARRREDRCRARSSAEGGSPNIKNFMKKKIRRAMESWPRRKPCVKERLAVC